MKENKNEIIESIATVNIQTVVSVSQKKVAKCIQIVMAVH